MLSTLKGLVKVLDTLKHKICQAANKCNGEHPISRSGFASVRSVENKGSHGARLAGNLEEYRAQLHRARALQRRDKERYIRNLTEDVKGHFNAMTSSQLTKP